MTDNLAAPVRRDRSRPITGEYVRVPAPAPVRIACVIETSAMATILVEAVATLIPGATVVEIDPATDREVPRADCVVIDSMVRGLSGADLLRAFRALGFAGSAVLLVEDTTTESADLAAGATRLVARHDLVSGLGEAIVAALRLRDAGVTGSPSASALAALRQAQRLTAVGALARKLQHALNNPLAALLAEAQLLELEELPSEHRESVERIVELTRRVIALVRGLDGTAEG